MRAMNQREAALEHEEPTEKVTFESALREQGIDETTIAKKLKGQLAAKYRRWNPKKKSYEEFDDYGAQLAAIREIVKIFGGYPSRNENDDDVPMVIDVTGVWAPWLAVEREDTATQPNG